MKRGQIESSSSILDRRRRQHGGGASKISVRRSCQRCEIGLAKRRQQSLAAQRLHEQRLVLLARLALERGSEGNSDKRLFRDS